jgi:hypothetical protein
MRGEEAIIESQVIDTASYSFDDISEDLRTMLGPKITIKRNSSELNITFQDTALSVTGREAVLQNYKQFIENDYAIKTNSKIAINISDLSDGDSEILFSNGLIYNYSYGAESIIKIYGDSGSTNITIYDITVYSNAYRLTENISSFTPSPDGNLTLNIHYRDLNGSIDVGGVINSTIENLYQVTYTGSPTPYLEIRAGSVGSSQKAFLIRQSGKLTADFNLTASIPSDASESLSYVYNANLNYQQLNASKIGLVEIGRG